MKAITENERLDWILRWLQDLEPLVEDTEGGLHRMEIPERPAIDEQILRDRAVRTDPAKP